MKPFRCPRLAVAALSVAATPAFCAFAAPAERSNVLPAYQQGSSANSAQGKTQKLRNPLNDLLDEAQAALDKNEYAAAVTPLQQFIAEKPDVAYAHFQLGYAYTALKRMDEARTEYERCVAIDPKMSEAQLNLGILLLEKDSAGAVAPLRKAVELMPSQSRPRYLLGLAQERSNDLPGAAESFEGAAGLDRTDFDALTHLGGVYMRLNRGADAERKFRLALQLQPKSPPALQGLAQSLELQKKAEAADAYREYLAVQPDDQGARAHLVHLLLEQKQPEAALEEMNKEASGQPATLDSLKLRADILIGQKKYDDAIPVLRQAITLAPKNAELRGGLGRIYLQKRDFPNAEKELKAALELDPNNIVYWKDLSSTFYLGGNYAATLSALDIVAKEETPGAGAWFIRALCYDKLNQVKPALEAYRKFKDLDQNRNPDQVWQADQRIHVLEKEAEHKR
jgi:protein O-GlcNAc transferase